MRISLRVTMEDLIRALRNRAHGMADEIERGYIRGDAVADSGVSGPKPARRQAVDEERRDEPGGR